MKKIITLSFLLFTVLTLSAQTGITKTNVIGKWVLTAVEMPGMVYYDKEKDSLVIGETMKAQIKDEQQIVSVKTLLKQQLAPYFKMTFLFDAGGKAEMTNGTETLETGTYTVDEENSTITTTGKNKIVETQKAEIMGNRLRIISKQPQGDVMMLLSRTN